MLVAIVLSVDLLFVFLPQMAKWIGHLPLKL